MGDILNMTNEIVKELDWHPCPTVEPFSIPECEFHRVTSECCGAPVEVFWCAKHNLLLLKCSKCLRMAKISKKNASKED